MNLADDEKAILDGAEGPARAHAMDLLVRYGDALGAERLVDTNNVCGGGVAGSLPGAGNALPETHARNIDAIYSLLNLGSEEPLDIPPVKAMTYRLIDTVDHDKADVQRVSEQTRETSLRVGEFCNRIGIERCNTCTPYQIGNMPVYGEHCAWMESSAVIYINSVVGARSNVEGAQSTAAASLVGKIPYWGFHTPERRRGTHHVTVNYPVCSMLEWGLMGYYIGEQVQEDVPVLTGIRQTPDPDHLKHFGAAAASSGGVEMYHLVGITPEAPTLDAAFAGNRTAHHLEFNRAQLEEAYGWFNTATDDNVDFIVIGCPHASLAQIKLVAGLLEGKKLHGDTHLWVFAPRALKTMADRMGYTQAIENAGAHLMSDSCAALSRVYPEGVRVAATDSCKQAHYLPAILDFPTWLGTTEQCVDAAMTGRWRGDLA